MSAGYMAKCSNGLNPKQRFEKKDDAERFRASMVARGSWTLGGSKVYPCNQCGTYHAGRVGAGNRVRNGKVNKAKRPLDTQ